MRAATDIVFAALGLAACDASERRLRTRAAYDTRCDASKLTIVELSRRARGVEGCGRRGTYVEQCNGGDFNGDCVWVLNTDHRPAAWSPSTNAVPEPIPAAPAQPAPAGT